MNLRKNLDTTCKPNAKTMSRPGFCHNCHKTAKKMTDIVYLPFLPLYALIHFPYGTVLGVVDSHYL